MPRNEFDSRDSRQGNQRRNVLYVLVFGIVLALAAMTAVNIFGGNIL